MLDRAFRGYVAVNHGQIVTYEALLDTVCACLRRRYAGNLHAVKTLARDQDVPENTAKNWLGRKCLPSSTKLLQMAAKDPALWREICILTGHEGDACQVTPHQMGVIHHMLEAFTGHSHLLQAASLPMGQRLPMGQGA